MKNTGGGTLASPTTAIAYGSGSGWLSVTTSGELAPYTLTNQTGISGLAAETYNCHGPGHEFKSKQFASELYRHADRECVGIAVHPQATTSSPSGNCWPYLYTPNTESNGSNTYVGNDARTNYDGVAGEGH